MLNELNFSNTLLQSYLTWLINLSPGRVATFTLFMFFAFFVIFEFYSPREKLPIKQVRQSYRANIGLFVVNSVVMTLLSVPSLLFLAEHYSDKGLLNSISNPGCKAILSFLAIDLLLYLLHKASHNFDCLWMFHKVHHNDPYLNVSTAFRLHFLEILIINIMKAVLIVVLGIEGTLLLANETIITVFTLLHHTNISFRGEQFLGRVMITPYLHRVHHSTRRNEHDRNYGAVLSIWDRLYGTLAALKPVEIGLRGSSPQDLINLVKYGFTMTDNSSAQPVSLDVMIAEAAYYKAEKRGFYPGNELRDWLEAKREIIRLVYGEEQLQNKLMQKWLDFVRFMNKADRKDCFVNA
ncbi:MAG: sterol desaturase family protein [Methylococcaceae bacterium]|jgi:sterol desaturase/sphingolipid hydroxylase (fatty acid hydroxylase superfamily)